MCKFVLGLFKKVLINCQEFIFISMPAHHERIIFVHHSQFVQNADKVWKKTATGTGDGRGRPATGDGRGRRAPGAGYRRRTRATTGAGEGHVRRALATGDGYRRPALARVTGDGGLRATYAVYKEELLEARRIEGEECRRKRRVPRRCTLRHSVVARATGAADGRPATPVVRARATGEVWIGLYVPAGKARHVCRCFQVVLEAARRARVGSRAVQWARGSSAQTLCAILADVSEISGVFLQAL